MSSVRKTLNEHDITPRKRLGQSFLEDMNMIRRIAALAEPAKEETVVEIGAGLGLLTSELAQTAGKVIALEIDPRLISVLLDRFEGNDKVQIVAGDVLHYDFSSANPGRRIKVIGNIPYHISSPILFRLIDFRQSISSMVLMFQKELADRLMAHPGTKDYGIPSVIIARYASITREISVPSTCFYPEPGVVSSVLRIVMHEDQTVMEEEPMFRMTVRMSFSHRRKTLWNNLRAAGYAEDALTNVFARIGIQRVRRAETLSVGEFSQLAQELAAGAGAGKILDKHSDL